jgi:putative ABC transport system permease protein
LGICLFLINQRTKEIGIRKILGASIANLFGLMIYRFMGLILVAGIFGIPVTWYVLNKLLQEFAIRIDLNWWIFIVPLAFIFIIALLTIGGNTLRKVYANPVEALRYE